MTRKDYETKTLSQLCEQLAEEGQNITSYETLKDFAKENIDNDNIFVAKHICESIIDEEDYYFYDYCMGTLEAPTPITSKEDIEYLIEEDN